MAERVLLGELEQLILLAVLRLETEAYAVSVREQIVDQSGVQVSRGTVYVTLDRLEKKGHLESWFADPTPERGGKAKRYYRVTPLAVRALETSRTALDRMWQGIEPAGGKL